MMYLGVKESERTAADVVSTTPGAHSGDVRVSMFRCRVCTWRGEHPGFDPLTRARTCPACRCHTTQVKS